LDQEAGGSGQGSGSGALHQDPGIADGGLHQQQEQVLQAENNGKEVVDETLQNQKGAQQDDEVGMAQTQGSTNAGAGKGEESVKEVVEASKPKQNQVPDPPFCHRCKSIGHVAKDCRRGWQHNRNDHGNPGMVNRKPLSELIASLCATQSDGQTFFVIPRCPSEVNARERINTAVVTILKGEVTAKLIEEEFTRILPGI
jgi:hypothetical protein